MHVCMLHATVKPHYKPYWLTASQKWHACWILSKLLPVNILLHCLRKTEHKQHPYTKTQGEKDLMSCLRHMLSFKHDKDFVVQSSLETLWACWCSTGGCTCTCLILPA